MKLDSKLMLGAMIDLRNGTDYNIDKKGTIETFDDCLEHIGIWLATKKYNPQKYRTWIIDGAMEGLGHKLRAKYNWASRVIVCFGHIYNRIYCNSFFISKLFTNINKNITFIKNFIDGSNIKSMQYNHFKQELGLITYSFDSNDPIRFISNYDAGISIIDNIPVLLKYSNFLVNTKEYKDFVRKYNGWIDQHQRWKQRKPLPPKTNTLTPEQHAKRLTVYQS